MSPPVELDTTLRDLYTQSGDEGEITLVYCPPMSQVQLVQGMPLSSKYAYQDRLPAPAKGSTQAARVFTQVLPQSHAMIAGKMDLVMLDLDVPGNGPTGQQAPTDAAQVFGQITESQRPTVRFIKDIADLQIPAGAKIGVFRPADCLDHLDPVVPFAAHFKAHSKRELALSNVPTAPSVVVDASIQPDQAQDPALRASEVARMLALVGNKAIPFVVKLPQAHGGLGTFMVRSEEDRAETLTVLRGEVDMMLSMLQDANTHFHPASLVVQDMVPGFVMAVCMFVPKTGSPLITSVSDQQTDDGGHWTRTHIDYSQQARLHTEYRPIVDAIGAYMHQLGYHGPLGADIMTGLDGQHLVIDLNARVSGSHPLGFLKKHLNTSRGFNDAAVVGPMLSVTIDELKSRFSTELNEGRIVLLGWSNGKGGESSGAIMVVAGEDMEALRELERRVMALSASAGTCVGA